MQLTVTAREGEGCASKTTAFTIAFVVVDVFNCIQLYLKSYSHNEIKIDNSIIYIYIYIYAFSRRFYPKRLTLHSSYSFYILSALAFPGNRTHDLGVASAMLYQLSYRKALLLFNIIIIIIILNEGALVIYNNLPSPSQQRLLVSDQLCATGQTSLLSNQSLT